jgi:hypothetical protein
MNQNVVALLGAILALMVIASFTARRDLIRQRLRYGVAMLGIGALAFGIAAKYTDQNKAFWIAIFSALLLSAKFRPRHSRYIPRRDRRRAIAEFERTGKRYDSKKHEIDHVVPYSRGGGSTIDNLKVIAKAKNRSKSNRPPWWDVFG